MKLTELLTTPYRFVRTEKSKYDEYDFVVADGSSISARFEYHSFGFEGRPEDRIWVFDFVRDGDFDLTGTGDSVRIFSTIIEIIKHFVKVRTPAAFVFGASKGEDSRVSLYSRLAKRVQIPGYEVLPEEEVTRLVDVEFRDELLMMLDDFGGHATTIVAKSDRLKFKTDEALDTKIKYDVKTAEPRLFTAFAVIDDKQFVFSATLDYGEGDYWDIEFAQKEPMGGKYFGVTNRGSQFKVGAFVAAAFAEFLDRYAPQHVTFSVDKEESPEARSKLYDRIMKRHGFELVREIGDARIYDKK